MEQVVIEWKITAKCGKTRKNTSIFLNCILFSPKKRIPLCADHTEKGTVTSKLQRLLDSNLISDAALARSAGLSEKTVKNVKRAAHEARMDTKRKLLDGLNALLEKMGQQKAGVDIFPG